MKQRILPSPETVGRILGNLLRPERYKRPLAVAFYPTFNCNAACDFCSQGDLVYGDEKGKYRGQQDLERQKKILKIIREETPNIYFEGGEPTVHPQFDELLKESSSLGFDTVGVNTNGLRFSPAVLEHATLLVASLHSTDASRIAKIYKKRLPKYGQSALDNIKRYARERDSSRTQMLINCVVTGDNIEEVYKIAEFCEGLGVQMNLAPAIDDNGCPDSRLSNNEQYTRLIDWLTTQNGLLTSSRAYLETIRDFKPFTCAPQTIPGVHPNGDMIVPCPNLPEKPEMINILEVGSVSEALRVGRERFEKQHGVLDTRRRCKQLCHKTCYVELSAVSTVPGLINLVRKELKTPKT